jgi:hypothetical protein
MGVKGLNEAELMSMYLVTGHFRKPYFCTLNNITKVQE